MAWWSSLSAPRRSRGRGRLPAVRTGLVLPCLLLLAGCGMWGGVPPGSSLQDCAQCPELVLIPPGEFRMGAEGGEEGRPEGPVRVVRIGKAFALGRYEVTQAQFAAFVTATGREMGGNCQVWEGEWRTPQGADWTNPGYGRTPFADEPVACVTWEDAEAYVQWLSRRTGQRYRLPSEAEWEYAARAGGTADYYWVDMGAAADGDACRYANVYDSSGAAANGFAWAPFGCDDGFGRVAPVGSFLANAFGLHDMIGNVWEWVADCYQAPYPPLPVDGSAVQSAAGSCARRSVRGGSWITRPDRQRASFRGRDPVDARFSFFGFRVAREP